MVAVRLLNYKIARKSARLTKWVAFGSGDTAAPYYNGARLAAEQDVIVASIKYV
jgi:hypothetical protein